MKIPSRFQLMGQTYTVSVLDRSDWSDENCWGEFNPVTNEVRILRRSSQAMTQTFCHELVHTILTAMNHKLNRDETFVDVFGSLLQQALSSAK